jgi:hypothetical protein
MSKRLLLPKPDDQNHLSKFGYTLEKNQKKRRGSLKLASKKLGSLPVLKRLNLIRNLTNPKLSTNKHKLDSDVKFLSRMYKDDKSKTKSKTKTKTKTGTKRGTKRGTNKRKSRKSRK